MARSCINYPALVPSESLGAYIKRYHSLSANRSWSSTSHQIFGRHIRHIHHYLPAHVGDIAQHFRKSAYELLMQHTAYPLFAYFLDQQARQKLAHKLMYYQDANVASLAGLCHIHSNRHGWVYCRHCQAEDIHNYGVPAYQVLFQIPGISLCPTHLAALETSASNKQRTRTVHEGDVRLVAFAAKVLDCAKSERWINNMIQRYWWQLSHLGYTASDNIIRYRKIKAAFTKNWNLDLSDALAGLREETVRLIPTLLHDSASIPRHPIKHLLLAAWLFGDDIRNLYDIAPCNQPRKVKSKTLISTIDLGGFQSIAELLQQGYSRRQIRQSTGVTDSRIVLIAKQLGVSVERRPKRLYQDARQAILNLADSGTNIEDIARQTGFHENTVCKIIQEEPGLVERRKCIKKTQARLQHQGALLNYISQHPEAGRKRIRQACGRAWTWLYRHDHAWLKQHLPPPQRSGRKPQK